MFRGKERKLELIHRQSRKVKKLFDLGKAKRIAGSIHYLWTKSVMRAYRDDGSDVKEELQYHVH